MNSNRLVIAIVFAAGLLVLWLLTPWIVGAAGCGPTHIVRRGDTLTRIARQCGTTVEALAAVNRIRNPDRIWIGQKLVIPSPQSGYEIIGIVDLSNPDPRCTAAMIEAAANLPADCPAITIKPDGATTGGGQFWQGEDVLRHCVYRGPETYEAIDAWGEQLHDGKYCPYPVHP